MPDANGNGKGQAAPPTLPVDDLPAKPVAEEVKLPPTPEERHKMRMDNAAKESDKQRSERRAKELQAHIEAHKQFIAEAHEKFPAPLHRRWEEYTDDEKRNWNERGKEIASANKAFALACQRTVGDHMAEDRHVRKLHDEAAKKAQENV